MPVQRPGGERRAHQLELTVRPGEDRPDAGRPAGRSGCALRGTVTEVVYLGTSTNFSVTTTDRRRRGRLPAELVSSGRRRGRPRGQRLAVLAPAALVSDRLDGSGQRSEYDERARTAQPAARSRRTRFDPSIWRGLTQPRMSRRQMLASAGSRRRRARPVGLPRRLRREGRRRRRGLGLHGRRRRHRRLVGQAEAAPHGQLRELAVLHRRAQRQAPLAGALHPDRPASRSTTPSRSTTTCRSTRRSGRRCRPSSTPATTSS